MADWEVHAVKYADRNNRVRGTVLFLTTTMMRPMRWIISFGFFGRATA